MPFKKGHNSRGGRPKGKEVRRNLTDNNTTGKEYKREGNKNKNGTIDKFPVTKKWDTSYRGKVLDPELVDYYINNDLDVTELIDDLKEYVTREEENEKQRLRNRRDYCKRKNAKNGD